MELIDIVKKLVGPVVPLGESREDAKRFKNLQEMCELANDIITIIDAIGYAFKDDNQHSVKKASTYARKYLTETIGIEK